MEKNERGGPREGTKLTLVTKGGGWGGGVGVGGGLLRRERGRGTEVKYGGRGKKTS